jgi:thiamine-phosphate pyrophosphorylase
VTSPATVLRIIDANLNRAAEGLRFMEELARLTLNDAALTERLKQIRHELVSADWSFNRQLLWARDAGGDVGVDINVPEKEEKELAVLVVANARRVQEALRVLEEIAKGKDNNLSLNSEKLKHFRFDSYTIERELCARLMRQERVRLIAGLYAIIDTQALKGRRHLEATRQVIEGGARIIQLRDKIQNIRDILPVARELRELSVEKGALFIVNDYLDLALAVQADGLHIGQKDLPTKDARRLLPADTILGVSTSRVEQAIIAAEEGADYIGCGAIYPTSSREGSVAIGLEPLRQIKQAVSLPVVAIGGIKEENLSAVMAAGADSVAVISAILGSESPEQATRELVERIESCHAEG